jgi:hypothetical protein
LKGYLAGFNQVAKLIYPRKVSMSLRLIKFSVITMAIMALSGCFGSDRNSNDSAEQKAPESEEPNTLAPIFPDPIFPDPISLDPYTLELTAPASVEQNTVFTMTAIPVDSDGAVSYQWSLNDDLISDDATHHTMLPVLGDYTLTVIATDEAGNEATETQTISVVAQNALNPDFSFNINVSDKSGKALPEVPVTINGTTVITDQFGLAQFDGISQTSLMLVSASKVGYLTQTYQYSFDVMQESAAANLTLQNINPLSHTVDSTEAIEITETELHTKLMLAASSFVDADGNTVTGELEITITPIDIRAVDTAFLGGGQALTDSGEAVALISMGMADYQFSQNGAAVFLAEGTSAIIEMDLALTTGDDGRIIVEGDTIEMWWFDIQTGFWIEDGAGTVQLSETSETGLKLVATVNHFTTWNWDYYMQDDRSSITFKCLKNNMPLLSDESCQITASSTSINRQLVAGSEGVTAINTSPNVTYLVSANLTTGSSFWSGTETLTTVPGDNAVSVNMVPSMTQTGYVQCRIINDTVTSIVPCTVISSGPLDQLIDTVGYDNYRASFTYIKGETLNISATTGSGLNKNTLIDTSSINGTLDIEIVFDIKLGSLQCSATLEGSDMQYFPCDAFVEDFAGLSFSITADNFTGTPLKANFTYSKEAQELNIEVASIFDEARLSSGESYGIDGEGTNVYIDLATKAAAAKVEYDVNAENLYTFKCVGSEGQDINCDITWFNTAMDTILFDGNINDLSGPDILPTWMNGKIFLEGDIGSGYARIPDSDSELFLLGPEPEVDTVNKVIKFTLGFMPIF